MAKRKRSKKPCKHVAVTFTCCRRRKGRMVCTTASRIGGRKLHLVRHKARPGAAPRAKRRRTHFPWPGYSGR